MGPTAYWHIMRACTRSQRELRPHVLDGTLSCMYGRLDRLYWTASRRYWAAQSRHFAVHGTYAKNP